MSISYSDICLSTKNTFGKTSVAFSGNIIESTLTITELQNLQYQLTNHQKTVSSLACELSVHF